MKTISEVLEESLCHIDAGIKQLDGKELVALSKELAVLTSVVEARLPPKVIKLKSSAGYLDVKDLGDHFTFRAPYVGYTLTREQVVVLVDWLSARLEISDDRT